MKQMRQGGSDRDKAVSLIDCVKVRCTPTRPAAHCKHLQQARECHASTVAPRPELLMSVKVQAALQPAPTASLCSFSSTVFLFVTLGVPLVLC